VITIHVVNRTPLAKDEEVAAAVAAIQRQVNEHLAPSWGVGGTLVPVLGGAAPPDKAWIISLLDTSDQPGDIGYHQDTDQPNGMVGVKTCLDDKASWTACLSHEVMELIVDPWAQLGYQVGEAMYSLEICDPVEGQPYSIDNVLVENFVLPSWFRAGSAGPWDYQKQLSAPLSLLKGGYCQIANVGDFNQKNGERVRASKLVPQKLSRRLRRLARKSQGT